MKEESEVSQNQTKGRGSNPRSLQNLKPFQKGASGNPGGLPRGTPKVSIALMKLLRLNPNEEFTPMSRAESIALALYERASTGDVGAIRELADRTEGKSPATLNLNAGEKAAQYRELAERLAAQYNKPLEQVVSDIIESRPETAAYFEGDQKMIAEGLALIDKAMRHRRSGPYQIQAAIAALHARAEKPEDTDWTQIDLLYGALEVMQPSPVVTLNRAVAVSKVRGAEAALEMIEPLASRLSNYFHFFGVRGAFLMQLGRNEEARVAFDRAIALANTSAEAAHIRMHIDRLKRDSARDEGGK